MIDLQTRPHSVIENWAKLRGLLGAHGPSSLQQFRLDSFLRFEKVGFPTHRDEEFKYLSLRSLEESSFEPAYGATVVREDIAKTVLADIDAITLTFVNGQYAPELSSFSPVPDGVFIGPLEDAFETVPELVETHLGKIASLDGKLGSSNDERFVHLNSAYITEGACVVIPKGVALEKPIHLLYVSKADHDRFVAFPRTLIVLAEHTEAKIVETYLGLEGDYWTNAVTEVVLAKDAILEHTIYQHETDGSTHMKAVYVHQEEGSTYTSNNANFGGSIVRNDLNVWLNGEHTETWLNGVNLATNSQVVDNHTRIDHAKPNCNSFEVYKAILRDKSIGTFNGKIFVYEDAQKTDAKQTNQGILLSPTATFNTKPQLEIFADDVKCTHGATVGQLREDALFYLRARGIPQKQAQALLVYAFAAEVLEKITIASVRDALEKVLFEKLNETEALPE